MKHKFLSKKYWNTITTPMAEVASLAHGLKDIINLSLGDHNLTTDARIIREAFKDAEEGHTRYTDPMGDPELRAELVAYYMDSCGCRLKASEVMAVVGACHGMHLALEAILDEGDEVIVPEPYFTPYAHQIQLAGGRLVALETYEEEGFQISIERLKALITNRTKAIIINSPNNPTGSCYGRETLTALAEVAFSNDLLVISDDVYCGFCFSGPHVPIIAIPGMKERTILIGSFSKDYAMTGWRIGYIIAPEYLIDCIRDINEGVCFSAPSVSQRAAIHALRMRETIVPGIAEEYKQRMLYAYERINGIEGMTVLKPQGSFYLFANIGRTGLASAEISRRILEEAKVLVVPGNAFGKSGEGYIRIACTVGIDELKAAFDRIGSMELFL